MTIRLPLELDPAYRAEMAQKYNVKIAKLAFDISQALKSLDSLAANSPHVGTASGKNTETKPTVYLAECAYDLREAREALETELQGAGLSHAARTGVAPG